MITIGIYLVCIKTLLEVCRIKQIRICGGVVWQERKKKYNYF